MDFGSLRSLARDANWSVHGVPATVELPNGQQITTRVIWQTSTAIDAPAGAVFRRRDTLRVLAVRRDEVPDLPRLSKIRAPESGGGAIRSWVVDAHDHTEADQHRVIVVGDPNDEEGCADA